MTGSAVIGVIVGIDVGAGTGAGAGAGAGTGAGAVLGDGWSQETRVDISNRHTRLIVKCLNVKLIFI